MHVSVVKIFVVLDTSCTSIYGAISKSALHDTTDLANNALLPIRHTSTIFPPPI